jgi:hypothetical protein
MVLSSHMNDLFFLCLTVRLDSAVRHGELVAFRNYWLFEPGGPSSLNINKFCDQRCVTVLVFRKRAYILGKKVEDFRSSIPWYKKYDQMILNTWCWVSRCSINCPTGKHSITFSVHLCYHCTSMMWLNTKYTLTPPVVSFSLILHMVNYYIIYTIWPNALQLLPANWEA